jgi:hypothetical protein
VEAGILQLSSGVAHLRASRAGGPTRAGLFEFAAVLVR